VETGSFHGRTPRQRHSNKLEPEYDMTIAELQQLIRDKYFATDNARGAPGTYLWFVEEVGELAHAIANRERGKLDRENLEEEFADVIAWLATLANICEVDLTRAIANKYVKDGGPEGFKI
jgi:NTP pyrophosphatase (non-canonical NTP hydrolase)